MDLGNVDQALQVADEAGLDGMTIVIRRDESQREEVLDLSQLASPTIRSAVPIWRQRSKDVSIS